MMNENNHTKSSIADEITYQAEIGVIFKKTLSIAPDGITWKNKHYSLDSITQVRCGSVKNSINALPLGTDYTIAFGDKQSETVISLRRKKVYVAFIEKFWKAVCVRLTLDILKTVASGKDVEFGTAVHRLRLKNDGVILVKHKFRGDSVLTPCSWEQVHTQSCNGGLNVYVSANKKNYIRLPYIGVPNVHILEKILNIMHSEPDIKLLSDLLSNY